MTKKRLILNNIGLQFFLSLNLLNLTNLDFLITYKYLTSTFKSSNTVKFLISGDALIMGLDKKFKLSIKKLINEKYNLLTFSSSLNFFKVLKHLSFLNVISSRLQFLLSNKSINRDLTFIDKEEFNFVNNLNSTNKNFIVAGTLLELTSLLHNEIGDQYNLGDWLKVVKVDLTIKKSDLLYLVLFNL